MSKLLKNDHQNVPQKKKTPEHSGVFFVEKWLAIENEPLVA